MNEGLQQTIRYQQKASDPNNCVFVAASAGSGKTKILTDRVLRLLLNGVKPSKILCLTFTKIAAFEMQNRIYQELSNWTILDESKLQEKIFNLCGKTPTNQQIKKSKIIFNEILDDFEGLKINTIHSFCQSLMTKFPIESEIKPNFQIIDSQTEHKLILEAKNKTLKEALNNSNLSQKIQKISSNLNENNFLEIILEIINKRADIEFTKEKLFGIENINELIYSILGVTKEQNSEEIALILPESKSKLLEIASKASDINKITDQKHSKYLLEYLNNPNLEKFYVYLDAFLTKKYEPRKTVFNKKLLEENPDYSTIIDSEQKRLINVIEQINSVEIANLTTSILSVCDKIIEYYNILKSQSNYLDYSDLITKGSKLLNNQENSQWIKYKLDGSIEHILVDESQDTNNNQWQIVKAISDDFFNNEENDEKQKTIFVVGDEKQSIYNFQGADPKIFGNVLKYYSKELAAANSKIHSISLNNSFRSLKNILDTVDKTFKDPKYKKAISPLNIVKHNPIKTNYNGTVEIWPIINIQSENKVDKNDLSWKLDFNIKKNPNSKEILAEVIAKKIKKWITDKKIIKTEGRAIEPKDIMILLKNRTNNLGNLIIKNLQKEKINVSGSDRVDIINNIIAKDLISFAKFLLLKEDDLNLASLLKSPIIGISEDDLFELCQEKDKKQTCLFTALKNSKKSYLKSHCKFLEDFLEYYHNNQNKIYQIFLYLLEVKNKKEYIISSFGKESKEILDQFLNLCLNFQNNEFPSLENFICNINNFDLSTKIEQNKNSNEVKITTIHSAKGLESKIVILADSAHDNKNKYGANNERILWINKDNIKIPIWSAGKDNELVKNIKEYEQNIKQEEYLRLLYVAMTRAEEELHIAGFGNNTANDCWYNIIKDSAMQTAHVKSSNFKNLLENQDIEISDNDQILYVEDATDNPLITKEREIFEQKFETPDFIFKKSKFEKTENAINPSLQNKKKAKSIIGQKKFFDRGNIIHKILEIFPNKLKSNQNKKNLIEKYLKYRYNNLTKSQIEEVLSNILNILDNDKFNFIFSENSKSEVPIVGKINNQTITGQIDRIVVSDDELTIVDYKSDQIDKSDISTQSEIYKPQLDMYKEIIQKIYPNKQIKSAIIWTYLSEISFV